MSERHIVKLSKAAYVELMNAMPAIARWVNADLTMPNCILYSGYLEPEVRRYMHELIFVLKKEEHMPITKEQLENWFTYHSPTPEQLPKYQAIREAGLYLASVIVANSPSSADQTDAVRKVREACMTANASIACGGQ